MKKKEEMKKSGDYEAQEGAKLKDIEQRLEKRKEQIRKDRFNKGYIGKKSKTRGFLRN